jgi:cobalt-precorrin 5A hydrolase
VGFHSDVPISSPLAKGLTPATSGGLGICISYDGSEKPFDRTLNLVPMDITIGVGCKRGTEPEKLQSFVSSTLKSLDIDPMRVASVRSIDIKSDEPAISSLGMHFDVPVSFYSADELMSLEGEFSCSDFVRSITSVDCVCERSACMSGDPLILRKQSCDGMTLALCRKSFILSFDKYL